MSAPDDAVNLLGLFRRADKDRRNAVIRLARDGAVVAASDAFLALVGYSRADFDNGAIDWDAMTPEIYWPLDEQCLAQLMHGEIADSYVKELVRKDASRVAVRLFAGRLSGHGEEMIAVAVELVEPDHPFGPLSWNHGSKPNGDGFTETAG
jgi:PAS domain S-box-containing protein